MDQNKRKGMWISQNQVGAGTGNTWVIPLITAVLSSEVLLAATIELVRSTDIYTPWVMLTAAGCTAAAYGFLIKLNKHKMFFPAALAVMLVMTVFLCAWPIHIGSGITIVDDFLKGHWVHTHTLNIVMDTGSLRMDTAALCFGAVCNITIFFRQTKVVNVV